MIYEELEKVLNSNSNIKDLHKSGISDELFERNFHFKISNKQYKITWYPNISTLYIGEVTVFFSKVIISGTRPNNAKANLEFYDNDDIVAILPIEYYVNQ